MDDDGYRAMIAAYYGMITHIDDMVGRLVAALEAQGQLDDTLIIFTSDHGDYNGDRRLIRKGPSLMGSLLYTPFIVAAPGNTGGIVSDDLSQHEDLVPSILQACNVPIPEHLPGHSFLARWQGSDPQAQQRPFSYFMHNNNGNFLPNQICGISDGHWKLSYTKRGSLLINEDDDPLEYQNEYDNPAAAAHRSRLEQALLQWLLVTPQHLNGKTAKW